MDIVMFPIRLQKIDSKVWSTWNSLHSLENTIVWDWRHERVSELDAEKNGIVVGPSSPRWITKKMDPAFHVAVSTHRMMFKHHGWEWCGLGFFKGQAEADDEDESWEKLEMFCLSVPYWSIVTPLTLLSAYLLLSKPRQSTAMKTAEPVPVEGL